MRKADVGNKVTSRDVYTRVSELVRPWAAKNGVTAPDDLRSPGPWRKMTTESIQIEFDFQVDKYGWSETCGSKLTMSFTAHVPSETSSFRYATLLNDQNDSTEFAGLAQLVASKIQDREFAEPEPLNEFSDPWMPYYDLADVERWIGNFILPRLNRMIETAVLKVIAPPFQVLLLASLVIHEENRRLVVRLSQLDGLRMAKAIQALETRRDIMFRGHDVELMTSLTGHFRGHWRALSPVDTRRMRVAVWQLGHTTRQSLVAALTSPPTEQPVVIQEQKGQVEIDSNVRVALT